MSDTSASAVQPGGEKPPLNVELVWQGDLRFRGQSSGVVLNLDSASKDGVSPMQALAFGLAGCMAMDLVHILTKARYAPRAVRASLSGRRPADPPSRFTAITLHFEIDGDAPDDNVARAIQLSRDKYCSVWNSMRQDIDFVVTFAVQRAAVAAPPAD
jgi:putative redox protein